MAILDEHGLFESKSKKNVLFFFYSFQSYRPKKRFGTSVRIRSQLDVSVHVMVFTIIIIIAIIINSIGHDYRSHH